MIQPHPTLHPHAPTTHSLTRSRRGSAYLLVLAATTIVTAAGVGALLVQRASNHAARLARSTADARAAALSGLELGAWVIDTVPTWRSTFAEGTWIPGWTLGNATVTVTAYTADGSTWQTNTDSTQRIRLLAKATAGDATQISTIEVDTETLPDEPFPALSYAAVANTVFVIDSGKTLTADAAPIASNDLLWIPGTLVGDAEALRASGGGSITGSNSLLSPALTLPPSSLFEQYAARGTRLFGSNSLSRCVLAPGFNAKGPPNAEGIYYIRSSSDVTIELSRLEGTLIVFAPGRKVTVTGAALLEPADDAMPTLLVEGKLIIDLNRAEPLDEDDAGNLNPLGAPYQGSWDLFNNDLYPNTIRGLVHATEGIEITQDADLRGTFLSGQHLSILANNVTITHDPGLPANPPEGYFTPGTTRIIADLATLQRLAQD